MPLWPRTPKSATQSALDGPSPCAGVRRRYGFHSCCVLYRSGRTVMLFLVLVLVSLSVLTVIVAWPRLSVLLIWPILLLFPNNLWNQAEILPWEIGFDDLYIILAFALVFLHRRILGGRPSYLGFPVWAGIAFVLQILPGLLLGAALACVASLISAHLDLSTILRLAAVGMVFLPPYALIAYGVVLNKEERALVLLLPRRQKSPNAK